PPSAQRIPMGLSRRDSAEFREAMKMFYGIESPFIDFWTSNPYRSQHRRARTFTGDAALGSPIPVPQKQSAFHLHAQRNAFRRREARHLHDPRLRRSPQLQPAFLRLSIASTGSGSR